MVEPPYGREIGPFIDKFILHKKGLMLIFARTGSKHFQKLLMAGAKIYLLRKRVYFIRKDFGKSTNAGADSCLVFWEDKYLDKVSKFQGILIEVNGAELL